MDKKKKIIVITVFVVFTGIVAFFTKSVFFKEEEVVVKKEFRLTTPDAEERQIDSLSKIDLYEKEAYTIKTYGTEKQLFADEVTRDSIERYSFNPFSAQDDEYELKNNTDEEISDEEQISAEQELMALLRAQAEIDAQAQDDILKAPTQYASQYVPEKRSVPQQNTYAQNPTPEEAEPVKPPSLSEKWAAIKEQKNAFKGIGGMSEAPNGLDLTPAETVDKRVLKLNSTVAFRLKEALYLKNQNLHIPKDAILYGKTSFGGLDRMNINIASYKTNKKIYAVSLQIYDFDGRPGIHLGNNALPKIPARVAKEAFNYASQKATQQPTFGGNDNISGDELKTIATTSAVSEILEEYVNKKRVFMPQKYHVWINIVD